MDLNGLGWLSSMMFNIKIENRFLLKHKLINLMSFVIVPCFCCGQQTFKFKLELLELNSHH